MASDRRVGEALAAPLEDLPQVDFAFAYGSGVFQQPGHSSLVTKEAPMVDYILGVKTPASWHAENMHRNPHHYNSWLANFGGKGVSFVADKIGAGTHFNAFVPWRKKMIKYGVISMDNLVKDILTWQSLYISGRLQKPVYVLVDNWDLMKLNQVNLHAAASAALLFLPVEFCLEDLYAKICSLSYMGDVRMMFAEDRNKVQSIVQGSLHQFHSLYRVPLCHFAAMGLLKLPMSFESPKSNIVKSCGPDAVEMLVSSLPTAVLHKVSPALLLTGSGMQGVHIEGDPAKAVQRAIRSIIRVSSARQAFSGLVAAGGVNAVRYVCKKVSKAWRSR